MPQLRQNIITGEWVVIAPERSKRPTDFIVKRQQKSDVKENCPFCPDSPSYNNRLSDFDAENIYVIPNKYPAFLEDQTKCSVRAYKIEDGFYNTRPSSGGHDVLIIKEHEQNIFTFNEETWKDLFETAGKRYNYWRKDCNTEYSMLIYNQGVESGASISHPHAQIFASNIVPNHITRELNGSQKYFENTGGCVYCDLLRHELMQKIRVVAENEKFIAFTFYAARFPFETWILPKFHSANFVQASVELSVPLSQIMQQVIGLLGKTLDNPPLNFFVHDLPTAVDKSDFYHWHIEIAPRIAAYGGFELGAGTIIDVMPPEEAANYMRLTV
ncbi:galactose-1-phosphate uridylyltransferase [Candidatus Berkelbacteria bacterium]|nr:galactose-1-phosphate uridylyltransferase [Candidatus Berkelbacteria bacterium]